jgi:hypothetical protein
MCVHAVIGAVYACIVMSNENKGSDTKRNHPAIASQTDTHVKWDNWMDAACIAEEQAAAESVERVSVDER